MPTKIMKKKTQNKKPKMNKRKRQGGFTLIELILVIAVLGILAAAAVPAFFDITQNARNAARDGIVGAVNGGLSTTSANNLVQGVNPIFPVALDVLADGTACDATNPCFVNVVPNGVTEQWTKTNATTYTWTPGDGTAAQTFTYDNAAGTFQCTANCT